MCGQPWAEARRSCLGATDTIHALIASHLQAGTVPRSKPAVLARALPRSGTPVPRALASCIAQYASHCAWSDLPSLRTLQLYMFRTMLESLCADDKKKSLKLDLDSKYYAPMLDMYNRSFFFEYLLNLNGKLRHGLRLLDDISGSMCCLCLHVTLTRPLCDAATLQHSADLSQLWYREFYLELTQGVRVQVRALPSLAANGDTKRCSVGLTVFWWAVPNRDVTAMDLGRPCSLQPQRQPDRACSVSFGPVQRCCQLCT